MSESAAKQREPTTKACKAGHVHLASTECPWCARIERELAEQRFVPSRMHMPDEPAVIDAKAFERVQIGEKAYDVAKGEPGKLIMKEIKPDMLASGTDDEGTVEEYVGALALKIIKHACIRQQMKVKLPNGAHKQMKVEVLIPEALNHVLTVIFSGKEVNDETLTWKPSKIVKKTSKLILPGDT